jgi:hypothetical protein
MSERRVANTIGCGEVADADLGSVPERRGMGVAGESLNAHDDLFRIDVVSRRLSMSCAVKIVRSAELMAEKMNSFLTTMSAPLQNPPVNLRPLAACATRGANKQTHEAKHIHQDESALSVCKRNSRGLVRKLAPVSSSTMSLVGMSRLVRNPR